jgi:hypothetical protein
MAADDIGELKALFNARFDSLAQQLEDYLLLMGGRVDHLEKETDKRFRRVAAAYPPIERTTSHAQLPTD